MCTGEGTIDKIIKEKRHGKFIDYVEDYFQLTPSDEQKGIRELHQDYKKPKSHHQKLSHQDSFCMSISKHSNGLASTI